MTTAATPFFSIFSRSDSKLSSSRIAGTEFMTGRLSISRSGGSTEFYLALEATESIVSFLGDVLNALLRWLYIIFNYTVWRCKAQTRCCHRAVTALAFLRMFRGTTVSPCLPPICILSRRPFRAWSFQGGFKLNLATVPMHTLFYCVRTDGRSSGLKPLLCGEIARRLSFGKWPRIGGSYKISFKIVFLSTSAQRGDAGGGVVAWRSFLE